MQFLSVLVCMCMGLVWHYLPKLYLHTFYKIKVLCFSWTIIKQFKNISVLCEIIVISKHYALKFLLTSFNSSIHSGSVCIPNELYDDHSYNQLQKITRTRTNSYIFGSWPNDGRRFLFASFVGFLVLKVFRFYLSLVIFVKEVDLFFWKLCLFWTIYRIHTFSNTHLQVHTCTSICTYIWIFIVGL